MGIKLAWTLSLFVLLLTAIPAAAQTWANKVFTVREHNFGTVARGADVVYRFEARNIYRQDIELVSVRSSCGCTTPSLEDKSLKTYETGYVLAKFNTRTFTGVHGATLTVTMQWTDERGVRRIGEAQLRVSGEIRSDVVLQPGSVNFSSVDQGMPAEQRIRVSYAGRSNWQLTNVLSKIPALEVELVEHPRQSGRVTYDLVVRLNEAAPAGELRGQLLLVTNDGRNQRIPVMVEGRVIPEISVAPESLVLGTVLQGEEVSKRVLIRGKKPFRIVDVTCDADCFHCTAPQDANQRHVVELTFKADREPGEVREPVEFTTDLGSEYRTTCMVYATIVPGPTETGESDSSQESTAISGNDSNMATATDSSSVRLATGP
jgi:hypothetical protein